MDASITEDDTATRVFVSGLPPTLSSGQLRAHFASKFQVTDAYVIPDRRIGFVGFNSHEHAKKASQYFNKSFMRMSKISVNIARPVEVRRETSGQGTPISERRSVPGFHAGQKRKRDVYDQNRPGETEDGGFMDQQLGPLKTSRDTHVEDVEANASRVAEGPSTKADHVGEPATREPRAQEVHPVEANLELSSEIPNYVAPVPKSDTDWLRGKTNRVLDHADTEDLDILGSEDNEEIPGKIEAEIFQEKSPDVVNVQPDLNQASKEPSVTNARLFVRNLPFDTSEKDLLTVFLSYGKVSEIHLVKDTRTSKGTGLGFVQFVEPKNAERAMQELDGKSFKGRLLHILPASDKRMQKLSDFEISKLPLKQQKAIKRKSESAISSFSWNSLYMNPDAVLESVADRLKVSKTDLLDPTSTDSAVKQAHAETSVIEETKQNLRKNGISIEAFKNSKRDGNVLLIKNFAFGTTLEELTEMLSPYGKIERCVFPSTGTMAIVRYEESISATQALKRLAYRNLKGSPLFLERAPEGLFNITELQNHTDGAAEPNQNAVEEQQQLSIGGSFTVFVRNLNFSTSGARLTELFKPLSGFLSARVKTRTDPIRPGEVLSMGFGFIEFRTKAQAEAAIATMNGHIVDGHDILAQMSHKGADAAEERRRDDNKKRQDTPRTKIIVKNLPFEASRKDVQALFGQYGQLRSVRMPKKLNNAARGFAFADFITAKEAENAVEALTNTHLLGRRLVIEFAEAENVDPEEEIRAMEKKVGHQVYLNTVKKMIGGSTRKKFDVNARDEDEQM